MASVKIDDSGSRLYTILFEDDDVLSDVVRDKIQFLDRPKFEDIDQRVRDLLLCMNQSESASASVSKSVSMVDLTTKIKTISDPERSEVYGQNDLC